MAAQFKRTSLATTDGQLRQAWSRLQDNLQRFVLTVNQGTGLGTVVYVDGDNGDDATGIRGSIAQPFATINAAYAAAQAGDTIFVGPGEYAETVVLGAKDGLTLAGSGRGATIIVGMLAQIGAAAIQNLEIHDITVHANSADPALTVDYEGTAIDNMFQTGSLRIVNVEVLNDGVGFSFNLRSLNNVYLDKCLSNAVANIEDVASATLASCVFAEMNTQYDHTRTPLPALGVIGVRAYGCQFTGDLNAGDLVSGTHNVGNMFLDVACTIAGDLNSALNDDAAFANSGRITCRGTVEGSVTVQTRFTQAAADHNAVDLDHSTILGDIVIGDVNSGPEYVTATARNAVLLGSNIESADRCILDIRNSSYDQAVLASSGVSDPGVIDRTHELGTIAAGGGAVVFGVPFSTNNYHVTVTAGHQADIPYVNGALANTGFTIGAAAANVGIAWLVTMNEP